MKMTNKNQKEPKGTREPNLVRPVERNRTELDMALARRRQELSLGALLHEVRGLCERLGFDFVKLCREELSRK